MFVRQRKVMLEYVFTVLIVKIASYTIEQRKMFVKVFKCENSLVFCKCQ
jgi:uncharacterized MnhB-related membrane protein